MRAAVDIAERLFAATDDEAVEAARAPRALQTGRGARRARGEAARGAVGDLVERAERDVRRGGGEALGQGSFALGKSAQQAS